MQKRMLTLGAMLIATTVAWMGLVAPQALAQRARVPQTGQTTCWQDAGGTIDCDRTGQDGDIQAGVVVPIPRFTDLGDGTVRDKLTGLIWHCQLNWTPLYSLRTAWHTCAMKAAPRVRSARFSSNGISIGSCHEPLHVAQPIHTSSVSG
jgi:hypothetical protein